LPTDDNLLVISGVGVMGCITRKQGVWGNGWPRWRCTLAVKTVGMLSAQQQTGARLLSGWL